MVLFMQMKIIGAHAASCDRVVLIYVWEYFSGAGQYYAKIHQTILFCKSICENSTYRIMTLLSYYPGVQCVHVLPYKRLRKEEPCTTTTNDRQGVGGEGWNVLYFYLFRKFWEGPITCVFANQIQVKKDNHSIRLFLQVFLNYIATETCRIWSFLHL